MNITNFFVFDGGFSSFWELLSLELVVLSSDGVELWYWKRSLLTKLSNSSLRVHQTMSYGVGVKFGPFAKRDLQASENS